MIKSILTFCLFLLLLTIISAKEKNIQPNIILIYADDLGMGMLGCYGQKIVKTPNIDRLANEGMICTRAYSSQYCCPARASLLMGVHDSHTKSYTQTLGALVMEKDKKQWSIEQFNEKVKSTRNISPTDKEVFLPQLLKQAGYITGQFGKLDWGFTTFHDELVRHGWDEYVGYYDHQRAHGFYPTYLWKNGKELPLPGNTHENAGVTPENYGPGSTQKRREHRTGKETYAPDIMLQEALTFIDNNKAKPFSLML